MAFKLRSGNKLSFKSMGSSPAKQKVNKGGEAQDQDKILDNKGNHVGNWVNDKKVMLPKAPHTPAKPGPPAPVRIRTLGKWVRQQPHKTLKSKEAEPKMQDHLGGKAHGFRNRKSPAKQTSKDVKYDIQIKKMINQKGNWNDGKKASDYTPEELARIKDPKYQAKLSKAIEAKEAKENATKKASPTKQLTQVLLKKRKGLGPREIGKDDQSREAAITRSEMSVKKPKNKYWYKINGQGVSKEAYIKYENKPGGDESGKQTNNPDVYGRKANNHGRGPKTK